MIGRLLAFKLILLRNVELMLQSWLHIVKLSLRQLFERKNDLYSVDLIRISMKCGGCNTRLILNFVEKRIDSSLTCLALSMTIPIEKIHVNIQMLITFNSLPEQNKKLRTHQSHGQRFIQKCSHIQLKL